MISMQLSEVARRIGAEHIGEDVAFNSVSTDSRSLRKGDLFVALCGEHFDGHEYIDQAIQAGASGAMVDRKLEITLPMIRVEDTRLGLGRLGNVWRSQFTYPVAGVTGSNGKTTVKEMIAAVMGTRGAVLATRGNLNNDIGVPLTLLRMQDEHSSAVIEMGANHPGEIEYLTHLTQPTVAVITNAASAHLEGFGSFEGVARAKGEIYSGLDEKGTAVINADDRFANLWMQLAGEQNIVRFGLDHPAEVSCDWQSRAQGSQLQVKTPKGAIEIYLPLPGKHNVMNALAAIAVAQVMGASLEEIHTGLESMSPVKGRLQTMQGPDAMEIIDDTYNANPASLVAGIEVLVSRPGAHWLVLGDMGELGKDTEQLHRQAGEQARAKGVDRLYATGALSRGAVDAFGDKGYWFEDVHSLVVALLQDWAGEGCVLVKGSRAMKMERVVEQLIAARIQEAGH